jgi:hypothetical protein
VSAEPNQGTVDRVIQDGDVTESSGLATSLRHPGVLWTHNDAGNPARIYAVGPDGRIEARVRVTKVKAEDWEAVTSLRGPGDTPMIAIGDIGDNERSRDSVDVVLLPEPKKLRDDKVRPELVLRLTYPDGASNAETLLADPRDGRLYLVTKDDLAVVYAVPERAWPGQGQRRPRPGDGDDVPVREATLERLGVVDLSLATDGTVLDDGRVALRSKTHLVVLPPVEEWTRGVSVPVRASAPLPPQEQGESLTVANSGLLVGSEGTGQPVLRVAVPDSVTPTEPSAPEGQQERTSPADRDGDSAERFPGDSSGDEDGDGIGGEVAIVVVLALVLGLTVVLVRRRG